MKKWISDKWYVSRFNYSNEVRKRMKLPSKVLIADCTLRDGEQQAGIVFRREDKVKIARKLDEIGIHQIEAGMPAVSKEDEDALRAIVKEGLEAKVYALVRAMKKDVDKVIDCGAWGVQISLPAGHLQIHKKLQWSEQKIIDTALEITDYAKAHGLWVNLSPYDTTRAKLGFLRKYLSAVTRDAHVDRVRLVDTVGCTNPSAIRYLVVEMKKVLKKIALEIHCHNDLGLATANTLAAVEAGAEVVSTTINGIGERAGNAATEEVCLALHLLYGLDLGIRYEKLYEASRLAQELSGVRKPYKPVVGENAFAHESGLSIDGLIESPFTAEGFEPELVGQKRRIVLGKKSGKNSVRLKLRELRIIGLEDRVEAILEAIKDEAIKRKRSVSNKEFQAIVKKIVAKDREVARA